MYRRIGPRSRLPEAMDSEARILVRAAPDTVYGAFREPERLKSWYFEDATLDLAPGGRLAF